MGGSLTLTSFVLCTSILIRAVRLIVGGDTDGQVLQLNTEIRIIAEMLSPTFYKVPNLFFRKRIEKQFPTEFSAIRME